MTTSMMSCETFRATLMAYLEGETDDDGRRAVDTHAQRCAECGALLADVRALLANATRLPELTPSRDLWAGIAARIEAPVVPIGAASPASETMDEARDQRRTGRRWATAALLAASLLGAVSLGYYAAAARARATGLASADTNLAVADSAMAVVLARDSLAADSTDEARASVLPDARAAVSAQLAVATLAADYDREIAQLRKLVDQRRNQMDPTTLAVIEKNLRVIDAAITESKAAIARDPGSRFLIEALNQSLESKVELLRIAAALPYRTEGP